MNFRTVTGWRSRLEAEPKEDKRRTHARRPKGRPAMSPVTPEKLQRIKELREQKWTIRAICRELELSVQTVWKHTQPA